MLRRRLLLRQAHHALLGRDLHQSDRQSNSYTPLGVPLEPTQLFEAAVELANFFILMWLFKRKKFDGQVLGGFPDALRRGPLFSGIHSRRSRARVGIRRNHDRHAIDRDLPGDYGRLDLVAEVVVPQSGSSARVAVGLGWSQSKTVIPFGNEHERDARAYTARAYMPQFPLLISATADDAGKRLDQFLVAPASRNQPRPRATAHFSGTGAGG